MMEHTTTCPVSTGSCQRLLIYKLSTPTGTQYFLSVLWQFADPTVLPRPINLYFLQI
jgi:hypothetical protein